MARLYLAIFFALLLAALGGGLWFAYRGSLAPETTQNDKVAFLGIDDYLLKKELYLRDASGKVKSDTVLLPIPPAPVEPKVESTHGGYVGPDSCAECHREKYESFVETSHYKTSALASQQTVLGSFEEGKNVFDSSSENLSFKMLNDGQRLVQRLTLNSQGNQVSEDFPFDLTTGSGKVGQTYLYWRDKHLYQLHVSYLTAADSWINSPGYHDGIADYARPTLNHCLECHTTYFQPVEETLNQFQTEHFVLGVTCEKCHGPGEKHVNFHQENPESKESFGITDPNDLSPERSLEICQLCHGGEPEQIKQLPFAYRPGERLDDYYVFSKNDQMVGVHSNSQLPRLKQSKCFTSSEAMTCVDCHNPHQFERGNFKLFSDRCMTCHESQHCGMSDTIATDVLAQNCIDCHMPQRQMEDIVLVSGGQQHSPPMRDHHIKVWPLETKQFLKRLEAKQSANGELKN